MSSEDKIKLLDECKDFAGKIDRKALAGAVGVMLLSWLGLPIVYWLFVRKKNDEKIDNTSRGSEVQKVRGESKEAKKS